MADKQPVVDRERLPNFHIPIEFTFNGGNGKVRPIVFYPDQRLSVPSAEVMSFDQGLVDLAADMALTMYMTGGVGLSAVQVGEPKRLLICDVYANADRDLPMQRRRNGLIAIANPKILSSGGKALTLPEGCLSFPGVTEPISRPFSIVVSAQNLQGERSTFECFQWFARIMQHEIDHLDGKLLVDHLGPVARRDVERRTEKLRRSVLSGDYRK